jgi:hypothetical protein
METRYPTWVTEVITRGGGAQALPAYRDDPRARGIQDPRVRQLPKTPEGIVEEQKKEADAAKLSPEDKKLLLSVIFVLFSLCLLGC